MYPKIFHEILLPQHSSMLKILKILLSDSFYRESMKKEMNVAAQ